MPLRRRIEAGFERWGRLMVRRPWLAIAACLALALPLVSRLPDLRVDNSSEAFLEGDDPTRQGYDRFKEQFGVDDSILVALRPPEIFEPAFLEKLRSLHRELERSLPYVEELTSLVNARNTRGEGDELIVEDLMEDWPENPADLETLRARVMANPLYRNILVSENGRWTTLTIQPFTYSTLGAQGDALAGFEEGGAERPAYLTEREILEQVRVLLPILDRHRGPELEIHAMGGGIMDHAFATSLQRDVSTFLALSLALEVVLLFALFRRVSGVLLPLLVVVGATASTLGLMVWLDIPFSVTLNMLPGFLLVVGVCDSVHILTIVYRQLAAGASREDAIAGALAHSGLAVVMTSVTTAAGLFSFFLAELAPISQLGILAPAGVLIAMVYSLVLLPALLAVSPLGERPASGSLAIRGTVDRLLSRVGGVASEHPWRIVAATALVLALALPGFAQVRFSHDGLKWFPEEDPVRVAAELLDREFKGTSTLEVLVHTGRENGLYEPEMLRAIERSMRHSETLSVGPHPVSKAISVVDVVKETHQALNENRTEFYRLPDERELIAQELLLFENSGSDDLEEVVTSRFETARVTVRTAWADALLYPPFVEEVERSFRRILGEGVEIELTGGAAIFTRVFDAVISSMARSYVFAFCVITPVMVLLIGSLRRGLVAMIPNLIPVYLVLALMGFTGIPLDAGTLLIGGVIIGLAVDDTIHFMHKFGRYYEDRGDAAWAVRETLTTTGSALLFTSLVLAGGFAVFLAAYMQNTFWFGGLCAFGTVVAFLADIALAPALMVLVTRAEARRSPEGTG